MGSEQRYMADAVARLHVSGDGHYTRLVHGLLEGFTGSPKALLTTSCTHALEMCALLLQIEPGDEVIMPSFTFVSTANAFVLRGARPVFVDIRADTLNVDEGAVEGAISARTRAIVVVHYAGVACAMDEILAVAQRHGIPVVEDNAHGLFGAYRGRPLGSFGTFATQSFHETKNVMCGEGGALLVNDAAYVDRAEVIREKGTNRARFFRGQVDKYSWISAGSSYLPSDILAAFLFAQLEAAGEIQRRRRHVWERYNAELGQCAGEHGVRLPTIPEDCAQAYHLFYILLPDVMQRDAFIAFLRERGIGALFHYVPLHDSEHGRSLGYRRGELPVTESCSERLVRLPMYNDMTDAEQDEVIEAALQALASVAGAVA